MWLCVLPIGTPVSLSQAGVLSIGTLVSLPQAHDMCGLYCRSVLYCFRFAIWRSICLHVALLPSYVHSQNKKIVSLPQAGVLPIGTL
jgi:hypothetical protein